MNFGTRDHLDEKNGHLTIGGADIIDLTQEYGTPLYVIDEGRIRSNYRRFAAAFPDADIYYAAKANGNLAVLRVLAHEGAGDDVVADGELPADLLAGSLAHRTLSNGNSKPHPELRLRCETGVRV